MAVAKLRRSLGGVLKRLLCPSSIRMDFVIRRKATGRTGRSSQLLTSRMGIRSLAINNRMPGLRSSVRTPWSSEAHPGLRRACQCCNHYGYQELTEQLSVCSSTTPEKRLIGSGNATLS